MRAAHEAQLRLGVEVLPHARIALAHALELRVVDDVHGRTVADERLALLHGLGREVLDVVQAHGTVGRGGRAEVLEIRDGILVDLRADPLVKPLDIRHFFHDLHADGGAEQLRLGLFRCAHLNDPVGAASVIGQKAEVRHAARDGAHELDHAGVAVAARAEHAVGVDHGGRFRPREHLALLGLVAHLVEVAGAGVVLIAEDAEPAQLLLIARLLLVHEFAEHQILQRIRGDVLVERERVGGELLLGKCAGFNELVVQVVDRLHGVDAEADDRVSVGARDGHHFFRAEGIAVHDERFHDLGHDFALAAVEHGLLFGCQFHGNRPPCAYIYCEFLDKNYSPIWAKMQGDIGTSS